MRELTEARYCQFFKIQKSMDEDMECEKCSAFFRVLQEPNPYKCRDLIFLKWWTDEIQSSAYNNEERRMMPPQFDWEKLAAYYPNPERAIEAYKLKEKIMNCVLKLQRIEKPTHEDLDFFSQDIKEAYWAYHSSTVKCE